jgi:hypothetical protein
MLYSLPLYQLSYQERNEYLSSMGLEPTTLGLLDPRSNQLSYEDIGSLFFFLVAVLPPHSTLKTMLFTPAIAIARLLAAEVATGMDREGFNGTMRVQIGIGASMEE